MDTISDPIGGTWLVRKYSLGLVMPLATMSGIGGRRSSQINDGPTHETYVEAMRPDATLRGHLTFHLKHEAPHLELLSRLFSAHAFDPQELATWFNDEPTGQYVRRACFL
ncbi:MAG: cell filamentation protein Fic, partial [Burkholderiaceae bacterium]|nr:cell filamentation protein Fic [Burkholderiaceae bacterium]